MPGEQYKQFDCYKILGVPPTATPQEIRGAYKQVSLRNHPDLGGSHEAQVRVNLAYEVLSDPIQRQVHDLYWRITATSGFVRPQPSRPYRSGQSDATTKPKQTQRETSRREPLTGLKHRTYQQVDKEKAKIWGDLTNRIQRKEEDFRQQLTNKRQEVAFILVGLLALGGFAVATQYSVLWLGVSYLGWLLLSRLSGVQLENRSFSIFNFNVANDLRQYAEHAARESCTRDTNNLERHFSSLASISELLLRSSTFDDSEEQVARRLAASFFLMGYVPLQFDRENRLLVFTDGEEKIIVRFRHRAGIGTNVTFVEKLVALMQVYGTARGFLFCSPGLSGNAANYANTHKVKWYTLETMNEWIENVLASDHNGPAGDILVHLEKLRNFFAAIAPAIAAGRYKSRFRHGRHRFRT